MSLTFIGSHLDAFCGREQPRAAFECGVALGLVMSARVVEGILTLRVVAVDGCTHKTPDRRHCKTKHTKIAKQQNENIGYM